MLGRRCIAGPFGVVHLSQRADRGSSQTWSASGGGQNGMIVCYSSVRSIHRLNVDHWENLRCRKAFLQWSFE